ncbi:DUF3142 domain-containing protein [Patescibacteria group bacterium]|nr:DUF3142 domain-containing protein [Patescibacteria group bacterium]MBU1256214.1 DUF3142 domain-containing protein [Patescibacteria group bacterium]MBU1457799.1 DUF3142 domain-containing protein [Patescibacteria group bacterium]
MNKSYKFFVGLTILILVVVLFLKQNTIFRKTNSPLNLILWVWERPENLYFMKNESVTYAYLAGTATKTDDNLVLYSRQQPLRIPDGSTTIATVRIEDRTREATFEESDIETITNFIVKSCTVNLKNISCQIDFDATQSQIEFYKKLILSVRKKLPTDIKLSITSLVSWCTNNSSWFDNLPINEVVPMFFRLGKDSNLYWKKIENGKLNLNHTCQKSIGISTDERLPDKSYLTGKNIYIFNHQYWDKSNWDIIKSEIEKVLNEN